MKKSYKLISMLLTVVMLLSSLSALFTVEAFADDATKAGGTTESGTEAESSTEDETGGSLMGEEIDYTTILYGSPEEKLASMRLALTKGDFQLYVDDYSGEVACINTKTGEKIFTNPYDVGASFGNETTKYEILSQIIVNFTDTQGQEKTFTSYEEAAGRNQITAEPIKNGLRVEYIIGREQTKSLVPRLISFERFEDMILTPALEAFGDELFNSDTNNPELHHFQALLSDFTIYHKDPIENLFDPEMSAEEKAAYKNNLKAVIGRINDNLSSSDRLLAENMKDYPIIDKLAVCVLDPEVSEAELAKYEEMVITFCPEYTYEELEYDHSITEYESEDENPPVFRMALEYKIDETGLSVRLPANGIRFNESLYTLNYIEVLPYMGAGNSGYAGYNFFPDGSGALFDFEELNIDVTNNVMGKVYGKDFAYHEIVGAYQKTINYPVFGIVEESTYYTYVEKDFDTGEIISENRLAGAVVEAIKAYAKGEKPKAYEGKESLLTSEYGSIVNNANATETKTTEKNGFVAIIEEGDALASLTTYHAGPLSDYNTIRMQFTPRPKDTYNLQNSISVGSNSDWTVVSDRKYVGGYKMRYILLSEASSAADSVTYDASWFGMAVAYRDYLTKQGVLEPIKPETLTNDIPLYVETFGAVETVEKILSVPVTVMAPLTTFENIITMYEDLEKQGIENVNFKLTGYANGGMYATMPGKLKFEKAVGGNEGFQELLNKAAKISANADKQHNLGIFPDFDLAYSANDEMFDGYSPSKHAARTIDDRYANFREYSATQQKQMNYYELVISPAYFKNFYDKLAKNYADEYGNVRGISVSTLGYALNSDFDEDEPYNREDSKEFTIQAFADLSNTYGEVMTSSGNAYVWKYVDHMLDVSLDSSRYNFSANAVPFIGVVLHGSMSFTGEPLNMEGDLQYAILKAIENGASPYFILSYQNTQALKEYEDLSNYYSIRYDIWNKDIADVYNTLNSALADVQSMYITNHEFLTGERVPDSDELEADILAGYNATLEEERNLADILAEEIALAANIARENGRVAELFAAEAILKALECYNTQMDIITSAMRFDADYYNQAYLGYLGFVGIKNYASYQNSTDPAEQAKYQEYLKANTVLTAVKDYNMDYKVCCDIYDATVAARDAIGKVTAEDQEIANQKSKIRDAYNKYATAKDAAEKATAKAELDALLTADVKAKLDTLNKHRAAEKAYSMVMDSYFALDFASCYAAALAVEEADLYSSNTLKDAALAEGADAEVIGWYKQFVDTGIALNKMIESGKRSSSKGTVDNYMLALAELNAMKALGFEENDERYINALNSVDRTRTNAINSMVRLESTSYDEMIELFNTANEYLELAVAAIEVVAEAENNKIIWDKESKDYLAVKNESELTLITKQAITRARNAYYSINSILESDKYVVIEDGMASDVVWNGIKLRYKKDSDGQKIYFAGTAETGYSYFKFVTDKKTGEEKLDIHHIGNKTGSGDVIGDLPRYEINANLHYTATLEEGYKYYTDDSNYNKYVPVEPTVLAGELVETLSDGTEIYFDGETYYSVNEDGSYTKYNYYQSVKSYYDTIINDAATLRKNVAAALAPAGDADFDKDVQVRIDRNHMSNDRDEEEVVEEEYSRYTTENIVAVTYGNDYKTILLNYNNYTVRIVYDEIEYTIPAYEFVIIK